VNDKTPITTARDLFAPAEPITTTRDRITAAALNMFYEHGFHAVGLDRVIREVGVTKTTFYNHFESKDELIVAALQMRDRWESASFKRTIDHFSDGTPRGTILACFDALDLWFNSPDYAGCLFITAAAEFPSPHDPAHQAAAAHIDKTTRLLRDTCAGAGVPDPDELARQLEMLLQGAMITRLVKGDNSSARSARAVAGLLLAHHGAE